MCLRCGRPGWAVGTSENGSPGHERGSKRAKNLERDQEVQHRTSALAEADDECMLDRDLAKPISGWQLSLGDLLSATNNDALYKVL